MGYADIRRRIVESSRDGLWVVDVEGRTLFANPRVAELFGLTKADLETLQMTDLLDRTGRDQLRAHLAGLRVNGPDLGEVECTFRRPDGSPVPLMVGESGLYDADGHLVGVVHRLTDDTSRRALVAELTRSRAQLDDAEAIARLGSWEVDFQRDTVSWSRQMFVLLDVDPDEFEPSVEGFADLLAEIDRPLFDQELALALRDPEERSFDVRMRLPEGGTRWLRLVGQVLEWDADGTAVRMNGTVQDIDALKETELRLVDAVELNTLMHFMATAVNRTSTIPDALVALRELLLAHHDWIRAVAFETSSAGLVPVELVGGPEPTALELSVAQAALVADGPVLEEHAVPQSPSIGFAVPAGPDRRIVAVITARTPFERQAMLRAMAEQVAGQLAQVAVREAAALELADARDAAMEASRAKSEFLATMSHEIRTPLNGVIGLNDLMLRTGLDPQQLRLAQGMRDAGHALLALINDILDFSKIEAGELELETVDFSLRAVVGAALELLEPTAATKGIQLDLSVDDQVPDRLAGDPVRFGQVLTNLASNAVKFTSVGQVHVHVGVVDGPADDGAADEGDGWEGVTLRVDVADTGIGLDSDQLERVFQPFRQADASTTRTFGGTGLGLAIATQLAAALGGRLGAVSAPGEGSTFWFTGRFSPASAAARPEPAPQPDQPVTRSGHVLVVEDNEVNQLVVLGMLEALGLTADVAENGAVGVERAVQTQYDVVLMDLQMPLLDGFEATRRIRAGEPAGRRTPIVAVTASATEGERGRCLAAGMDGFLTKPIALDRLGAVLDEQLNRPSSGSEPVVLIAIPESARRRAEPGPVDLDDSRLAELAEMGEAAFPLIQRAIDNFVVNAPGQLDEIRAAIEVGDCDRLESLAHRLKGSATNLGAVRAGQLCLALQTMGAEGHLDEAADTVADLGRAVVAASAALRGYRLAVGA